MKMIYNSKIENSEEIINLFEKNFHLSQSFDGFMLFGHSTLCNDLIITKGYADIPTYNHANKTTSISPTLIPQEGCVCPHRLIKITNGNIVAEISHWNYVEIRDWDFEEDVMKSFHMAIQIYEKE